MKFKELENPIRKEIFFWINKEVSKFNELKNTLNLRSNELSYHLKLMLSNKLIEKRSNHYYLTEESKNLFPYRKAFTENEIPLMIVSCVIISNKNKVLLQEKQNQPGRGQYILFGGTINFNKSIIESAKTIAERQSNTKLFNLKFKGTMESLLYQNEKIVQHWLVNIYTAKPESEKTKHKWFKISKLPNNVFLDTKIIIKEFLRNKKTKNLIFLKKNNKCFVKVR